MQQDMGPSLGLVEAIICSPMSILNVVRLSARLSEIHVSVPQGMVGIVFGT